MKGHRYASNEPVEVHCFRGKNAEQLLKRLGKWLDEKGGVVVSIDFCDDLGARAFDWNSPPLDPEGHIWLSLTWEPPV